MPRIALWRLTALPELRGSASHLEALAEERGRHPFQPESRNGQQGFLFGSEV